MAFPPTAAGPQVLPWVQCRRGRQVDLAEVTGPALLSCSAVGEASGLPPWDSVWPRNQEM